METAQYKDIEKQCHEDWECDIVSSANDVLSNFLCEHGRALSGRSWSEYSTYAEVDEALRLHRMRKKFCQLDETQERERYDRTLQRFLRNNQRRSLHRSVEWFSLQASHQPWLAEARRLIHELFLEPEPVRFKYMKGRQGVVDGRCTFVDRVQISGPRASHAGRSFNYWQRKFSMEGAELLLGPGEQYISAHGDVSTVAKMHHHTWTVTADAEPLAKAVIRKSRAWRRIVMREGYKTLRGYGNGLSSLSLRQRQRVVFEAGWKAKTQVVNGSRLAQVPKNNEINRLINVEPLLNVGLQKWLGNLLATVLKKAGMDLETGQSLHRRLIRSLDWLTVDFSAASDSYGTGLIDYLFPDFVTEALMKVRSNLYTYREYHEVKLPSGETREDTHDWCERANVYACMGNGTTFPVLTLIVWALGRAISAHTTFAYGDDLIVHRSTNIRKLFHCFEFCGFTINADKSFTDGLVRESCGAYTREGAELRSYDIKSCSNLADVIVLCNKLYRYMKWSPWKERWKKLWESLVALVPSRYYGPPSCRDDSKELPIWCEHPMGATIEGSKGLCAWLTQRTGAEYVTVVGRVWVQSVKDDTTCEYDRQLLRIHTGAEPTRHLRGEGKWVDQRFIVETTGELAGSATGIRIQRSREADLYRRLKATFYMDIKPLDYLRRNFRYRWPMLKSYSHAHADVWAPYYLVFFSRWVYEVVDHERRIPPSFDRG